MGVYKRIERGEVYILKGGETGFVTGHDGSYDVTTYSDLVIETESTIGHTTNQFTQTQLGTGNNIVGDVSLSRAEYVYDLAGLELTAIDVANRRFTHVASVTKPHLTDETEGAEKVGVRYYIKLEPTTATYHDGASTNDVVLPAGSVLKAADAADTNYVEFIIEE